jgi:small subunit ribosomal protein S16
MSVAIRLSRGGSKANPFYRIIVADSCSKRDGKFLEKIGTYSPKSKDKSLEIKKERLEYWLGVGAKPTKTVAALIKRK